MLACDLIGSTLVSLGILPPAVVATPSVSPLRVHLPGSLWGSSEEVKVNTHGLEPGHP